MGFNALAPLTATRIRNLAPVRNKGARRQFVRGFADVTGPRTTHETLALPAEFEWVRFWYANDTATPITLTKAAWSPSADKASAVPRDSAGAALGFQAVTFNAGGADSLPGSTSGSTATITIPVGTSANPNPICSDWMQGASLPRRDGGTLPLLMHRAHYAGAYRCLVSGTNIDLNAFEAQSQGLTWTILDGGGDQTTSATPSFGTTPRGILYGVEFLTAKPVLTVMGIGDSLMGGQGSTSGFTAYGMLACAAVSTPARPVSFVNSGWSGQTTLQFFERGRAEIARFQPPVAVIAPWSPNDAYTSAPAVAAGVGRGIALAQAVRAYGGVPVFVTPMPTARIADAAAESYRTSVAARMRALAGEGWLVADLDRVLTDGAGLGRLRAGFDSGDGTHLNDAGYAACGTELARALRQAVAL